MKSINKRCCMLLAILMMSLVLTAAFPITTQAAGIKLKMYNIWGTDCPPCLDELADLGEISRKYQGVIELIGLQSDAHSEAMIKRGQELLAENNCIYKNLPLFPDFGWLVQVDDDGYYRIPQTHFVDQNNQVVQTVRAARDYDGWAAIIEALLADMKEDPGIIPGDLDDDGDVDLYDLQDLVEYLVSRKEPTSLANADVNQSGKVDEEDAEALIALILAQ